MGARRRLGQIGAAIAVSAVLAAVAFQLHQSQRSARETILERRDDRVALSAEFVGSYVEQLIDQERSQAVRHLAGLDASESEFTHVSDAFGFQAAVWLDSEGRVLGVTPAKPELLGTEIASKYSHLTSALRGEAMVSDVVPSAARGVPIVGFATPYPSAGGRRVFSGAFEVERTPISKFIQISTKASASVYLLDSKGAIAAATVDLDQPFVTLAETDPPLAAQLAGDAKGTYERDGRSLYFTSARVPGSPWVVVAAEPLGSLLAPVEGPSKWVPWVLFGAVAALFVLLFFAASRYIEGRRELAVARDAAMAASEMKSQFLANMSHEIRTPLNGVIGMNSLVLGTELTAEQRGYLEAAQTSGENLLELINDILDLAKVEAGRVELDISAFSVRDLVATVLETVAGTARAKGIVLSADIDPSVPVAVCGDRTRVRQILINLVANAVKFTDTGTVSVLVDRRGEDLVFTVVDTGVGIDPAAAATLFQPFVQADTSTTRRFGGTGLGLTISRQLAELMAGSLVLAASAAGVGSTFRFSLPCVPAEDHTASNQEPAVAAPAVVAPGRLSGRVLVAEDNPVNQKVVAAMLDRLGVTCEVVADGADAVLAAERERYDAVLMDCQMPVLDGYEAARRIRALEAGLGRHTPIVALTAATMAGDRDRAIAAGMDEHLPKPVHMHALRDVLAGWLVPAAD